MLERIEGRKQDYVVTNDGGLVTLTGLIFAQHFHAFGATEKMQLYQDKAGEVIVKVVPTSLFSERDSSEIKTRMETAVGGRLKVTVEIVDDIPRTQRGKYRFLEQKLDIGYGDKQQ
jgi:phenylacetate-CoA ligase